MKFKRSLAAAFFGAALAACAGPQSRIKKHQALFDSYPPPVQRKIQEGQADVGFTKEQAAMAMGRPERIYTRKTASAEQEVWAYGIESSGPQIGFGMGMGGPGFSAVGVGLESGGASEGDSDARVRVVFQNGLVVSVESRQK